ncbi:hypothetical protein CPB84DRAFT_1751216 [Gymnopilus junonius]|uniref:Uncharacterized protein n=1 Tax=Gymnopilus junonius TaxID=109634 RepID=A0A9P5ND04_GYMJU|nr:hypothetical protein CPB84DRAFT_1751216 [Gymnopilus junonius]
MDVLGPFQPNIMLLVDPTPAEARPPLVLIDTLKYHHGTSFTPTAPPAAAPVNNGHGSVWSMFVDVVRRSGRSFKQTVSVSLGFTRVVRPAAKSLLRFAARPSSARQTEAARLPLYPLLLI